VSEQDSSHPVIGIVRLCGTGSAHRWLSLPSALPRLIGLRSTWTDRTHQLPRVGKFLATLEADLLRSSLDGNYAAQFVMVTPEGKLENPKQ